MTTSIAEQSSNGQHAATAYDYECVARAGALVPLLRENAAETEQHRVIHPDNIDALRQAGLFTISTPRRFGGSEHNLRTFVEAVAELGRGCGSTAWVASLQNGTAFLAGLFSDRCQQDVWEMNPYAQFCGVLTNNPTVTSKRVEGGWRVSGSWGFASGCLHADWALISFPVVDEDDDVIDAGIAMMPMANFTIKDTWHVAAMRGTGSNTIVGEDLFVPEHRVTSIVDAVDGINRNEHPDEALYRSAFAPFLCLVVLAPMLGMVAHSIEYIDEILAKEKPIIYSYYPSARMAPGVQRSRAAAQVAYDDAWLHVRRAITVVDEAAAAGVYPDIAARTRIRMDVGNTLRLLRTSMQHLLDIGGAGSFAEACPLQRNWRDLEMASRHGVLNPQIAEDAYGRHLVGIDEPVTPII
jgi:3-hydroxy-9,10-secoandrosta-1,3,5(10)-triene-9,17-dione monooxygenase